MFRKFCYTANPQYLSGVLLLWQTLVDAPLGDVPVALNLASMGKGEAWVNGYGIGRYWPSYHTPSGSSQIWYIFHKIRSFWFCWAPILLFDFLSSKGNWLMKKAYISVERANNGILHNYCWVINQLIIKFVTHWIQFVNIHNSDTFYIYMFLWLTKYSWTCW